MSTYTVVSSLLMTAGHCKKHRATRYVKCARARIVNSIVAEGAFGESASGKSGEAKLIGVGRKEINEVVKQAQETQCMRKESSGDVACNRGWREISKAKYS